VAETEGIDTGVPLAAVARAVETLYEEIDGDVDLDAFHDGTAAACRLLEFRHADPRLVLDEALRLHAGEPTIMLIAMAVSLAGEGGQALLGEALCQARCTRALTSRRSTKRSPRAATTSRGEHQAANRRRTPCNQPTAADTQQH
jgi:hypothetical protein